MEITGVRHWVVVLGDQLDPASSAYDGFDPTCDRILMAEVRAEATHVWSHRARIAMFLAAMRHHAEVLRARGWPLVYLSLGEHPHATLGQALDAQLAAAPAAAVVCCEPGEWRVREELAATCAAQGVALSLRPDRHFLCSIEDFGRWAHGRREFRLEHFYRHLRRALGVLMEGTEPAGGRWNFDADNRKGFDARGPGRLPPPRRFEPDAITQAALATVEAHYPDHPGSLEAFDWPVTADQAALALADFVEHRLVAFGRYQDAMWQSEPWLYHSRLSAAMNLKLLDPRTVIDAAVAAWRDGRAPIAAVEGFVRQILGWREYVRGLYWLRMPGYLDDNALAAQEPLPGFYWTGETDLACLRDTLQQTLRLGYAHHIQRLMVTGLYALLLGVQPRALHEWYLAVYVDAVEWVELPNTIGMSQYADGGIMASKPYCASGKYIERMSNHCQGCRYDPAQRLGERACPFTTLYWDFLLRHAHRFARHPRTALQWKHVEQIPLAERAQIQAAAARLRRMARGEVPETLAGQS